MTALIDGDIVMYRLCWTVDPDTSLTYVKTHVDNYMKQLLDKVECSEYIGILGIHGSNNVKYLVAPDYKRGRPTEKPPHWNLVMNYLITKWGFTCVSGCETDDAIAYCAAHLKDYIVVSADKDLLQIPGKHFVMGVLRKGKVIREDKKITVTAEEGYKKYLCQLLSGDSVDNVKGVPGIGPKTALKIVEESENIIETIDQKYQEAFGINWQTELTINSILLKIDSDYARAVGFVLPAPVFYKNINDY